MSFSDFQIFLTELPSVPVVRNLTQSVYNGRFSNVYHDVIMKTVRNQKLLKHFLINGFMQLVPTTG